MSIGRAKLPIVALSHELRFGWHFPYKLRNIKHRQPLNLAARRSLAGDSSLYLSITGFIPLRYHAFVGTDFSDTQSLNRNSPSTGSTAPVM